MCKFCALFNSLGNKWYTVFMRCEVCHKSTKDDPQSFPWIHRSCAQVSSSGKRPDDPERIIHEFGAKKLSETREGQKVLDRARKKYAAELVQPGDPEFNKLYGKQVKEREEARRELQRQSREAWEAKGGRETKVYEN